MENKKLKLYFKLPLSNDDDIFLQASEQLNSFNFTDILESSGIEIRGHVHPADRPELEKYVFEQYQKLLIQARSQSDPTGLYTPVAELKREEKPSVTALYY
jgi:hypothetical protein